MNVMQLWLPFFFFFYKKCIYLGLGVGIGKFLSMSLPLSIQSNSLSILISIPEWQKRSSTQSSAPKATSLFFPQIMSAQDCEHEHIELEHTEEHLDKI